MDSQYTLRITPDENYSHDDVIKILKDIPRVPTMVIAAEHSNRPHFHVLIRTPMCRAWVFNIKRKFFPLWKEKKNEVWSTHDCNRCEKHPTCIDGGLTYVCKDGVIPFYKGFTDDEIADAIKRGASLKPKPKKKKEPPIAEQIVAMIEPPVAVGCVPTGEQVLTAMILFYETKRNRYIPSTFHVDKMLHQIAMLTNESYRRQEYAVLRYKWDNSDYSITTIDVNNRMTNPRN